MTGKTHVICSTAAVAVYAVGHRAGVNILGADIQPLISIVPAAVGALLPDIDIPQSRLGSKFKLLSKNMKHRGITHTLLVPALLVLAMTSMQSFEASIVASIVVGVLISMIYGKLKGFISALVLCAFTVVMPSVGASIVFGLAAGWLLHIFEDLFNYKGCPIFWPIAKGHIHIASFKTRHWSEYVFMLLWLGGCAVWALSSVDLI